MRFQQEGPAEIIPAQKPADIRPGDAHGALDQFIEKHLLVADGDGGLADIVKCGQLVYPLLQFLVGLAQAGGQFIALTLVARLVQGPLNRRYHFRLAERPEQGVDRSKPEGGDDLVFHSPARNEDDRHLDRLGVERHQHVFTAQAWQVDVHQQHVRRIDGDLLDRG